MSNTGISSLPLQNLSVIQNEQQAASGAPMKKAFLLVSIPVAFIFVNNATGQSFAYESFTNLPLGSGITTGPSDSFGWSSGWSGVGLSNSHFQIIAPVPSLSYQISGGGLIQGGNRALQLSTNPEPVPIPLSVTRNLPSQNTTIYLRFLLRFSAIGTGTDSFQINLRKGSDISRLIRITPVEQPSSYIGYVGLFNFDGGGGSSGVTGDTSMTHLVVLRLTNSACSIWFDPSYTSSPFHTTSGQSANIIDGISLNISSTDSVGPTSTIILDEFRLGYTWADVVSPPDLQLLPTVTIRPAVNLQWQTVIGKKYQVQYSYDLVTWYNQGLSISGTGSIKEAFDSTNSDSSKFYRIQTQ